MNIWVLGRNYPLPKNGMQGSFELEQANMLVKKGENVCYLACCLHPTKRMKESGIHAWTEDGLQVFTYSKFFLPRIFPVHLTGLRNKYWSELLNWVKDKIGLPDVIHVHYPAVLMIADALLPFKEAGVKIVVTEHWTRVLAMKLDSTELSQYKKYANIVDTFICVGEPLADAVQRMIKVKPVVIPNVVNPSFVPSDGTHVGYEFIAVGRLEKVKQIDKIIQSFSNCFWGGVNVHLSIIGSGSEKKSLTRLVKRLKIGDQVTFLGSLKQEVLADYVSHADCLICYSNLETFGVPIIEAWACGIPVIASIAAAVINKWDDGLGVQTDPHDISDLEEKMKFMYYNRQKYDKDYISNFATSNYSEKVIYKHLLDIYSKDENMSSIKS